ncbi:MAG TPA: lysophospholipid acyltransferase family protein [Thermoanaerobaculia bacterium]|jgi:1-acyl-sn-glycerol-3-phosphate acyltransferase
MPRGGESVRARNAITALLRFALRIFYRRIEVVGMERVPADRPVIFAVNHPNGLVDPLFVICFVPRAVSFLAKAPLFGYPLIGWIVRSLDAIPVYRKQDNTKGTNAETFAKAREVLGRNGSIAIFPEGTTHSDPQLRELKTGAARIALGANVANLTIVPTGIYYKAKQIFRSDALVVFGEPLTFVDASEEDTAAVEALTDRIDAALDSVTLQADSRAALDLIALAEDIFTLDDDQPLAEELELRRRFIDGYHHLAAHDPARLDRVVSQFIQFEAEMERADLDVDELRPRLDAKTIFRVVVLLPLAIVGAIVNYPTYRLIGLLARKFAKEASELVATMKFIGALALYPLTYLLIAGLIWRAVGLIPAVATLLVLPILALIALLIFEDLDRTIGRARAILLRRNALQRLRARRRELKQEVIRIAEEIGV